MKTERRHELQKNWLADHLGQSVETAKPYTNTIIGIVVAAVIIIGTAWFLWQRSVTKRSEAWNQYLTARSMNTTEGLEATVGRYPSTQAAQWALITLADQQLEAGTNQLFEDKEAARDSLQSALENYSRALQSAEEMIVLERATYGVGVTREAMGELDEARKAYNGVITEFPNGLYAQLARERIEALDRPAVQNFYDWFANWTPPKKAEPPSGEKPPADLESLPDTPDLPSVFDSMPAPPVGVTTGEAGGPAGSDTTDAAVPAGASTIPSPAGTGTNGSAKPAGTGTTEAPSEEPAASLDLPGAPSDDDVETEDSPRGTDAATDAAGPAETPEAADRSEQ